MADQIIEMRQKTQQRHPQPGSHVTHHGRVIPEIGQRFDGAEHREILRTFDFRIAQLYRKVQKILPTPFFL
jgi:hypothetical protein